MKSFLLGLAALLIAGSAAMAQTPGSPATFRPNSLAIDSGTKTATAVSGAVTLNKGSGVITTESLTTAAAGSYVLTLTDSAIAATDIVFANVWFGTSTTGIPEVTLTTPAAGSVVIQVHNDHATAAFNGTLKIGYFTLKQ